jgi:hypothetical protein
MAITVNFNGATIRKPGSYSKTTVNLTGGFPVAPAGLVGIVGEADAGAPGSAEDITENFFGPNQLSEVTAKYKSGPIVDAFRALIAPSSDARVVNGANRVFVYKTNASTQATGTLPTAYGTLTSQNYGTSENLINFAVSSSQAESGPALPAFNFIPDENTASATAWRVSGGAEQLVATPAADTPVDFVGDVTALTDITATGGTDRGMQTTVAGTLGITVTAGNIGTLTISTTWDVTPTVGDTLYIPTSSVISGAGNENVGGWVITSATTTTAVAFKLGDPSVVGATVAPAAIVGANEVSAFSQVTIVYSGTTASGVGASLEVSDDAGAVAIEEQWFGGTDRAVLNSTLVSDGSTLALAVVSGASVTVTVSSAFAGTAVAGDLMWIRPGSVLASTVANVGAYRVTAVTGTVISATKLSGTPVAVPAADIVATTDLEVYLGVLSSSTTNIVNTSSAEPKVQVSINRQSDDLTEDSAALGGDVAMLLGYFGTTATVTITATTLSTTVTGGTGANLSITLADYATLNDLVTFINAQTGYTCTVGTAVLGQKAPSILDRVVAAGICASVDGDQPGRIKNDSQVIQDFFDTSTLVTLVRTLFLGLPTVATTTFLSGGAKGGTTAASASAGIDDMQKVRINSLVPLFSRDATDDILDELTEASSTYQIDAINAAAKTHVLLMSNTLNRSERNAYVSFKGPFTDAKDKAQNLASERVSMALQDVKVLKTDGTLEFVNPWGMASIAAGMQAGAPIGEPMTFKFVNVSGLQHEDFDPATQADDAIDNGLLFAEAPEQGGFRMVVGNTTYGKDASFVFNRISVLYASDTVAFNLRQQLEDIFVGVSSAVASASSIKNTVISIMATFRAADIIVGDDTNGGLGFKNLSVSVDGNTVSIDVTITPAQGVDFILPSIILDNIRQTA